MRHRSVITVLALLALAACDTLGGLGDVSTTVQVANNYRTTDYRIAANGRDMWVIVRGTIPGADHASLQQATLAAMQRHATVATRFTAEPQNAHKEYKTVMVFNGPANIQASALCRDPDQVIAVTPATTLRLQAVFCRNDQFLTEVYGRAGGGNSLTNAHFDGLIRQTMADMYEAPREEQRDEPGT